MEALLLAADVVEEARDIAAARARVAQLPFVAQPLGAHPGAVIPLAASAAPVRTSARLLSSGATTPLRSPASPASPAAPRAPSRASSSATLVDAAQAARAADAARAQQAREITILREAYDAQQVLLFVNGTPKGYSQPRFPDVKTRRELAARTGRTERQVQVWFQNERQRRQKREQRQTAAAVRAAAAAESAAAYAAAVRAS